MKSIRVAVGVLAACLLVLCGLCVYWTMSENEWSFLMPATTSGIMGLLLGVTAATGRAP